MQENVPRLKATARGQVRFFERGQELVAEQEPKTGFPPRRFAIVGQAKPLPMRLRLLLALLLGALSALAMPPFFLWPVLFLTLSGLVLLLDGLAVDRDVELLPLARWRRRVFKGAGVGWAFGCGYFGAGIYWVAYAFFADPRQQGPLLVPSAIAGALGLTAALAIFYALAGALAMALWRKGYARIAAFVLAFFLAEMARSLLLTGFPWNLFGEALTATSASMQAAAYIGLFGLTLLALYIFTAPAALLGPGKLPGKRRFMPLIAGVAILCALEVGGALRVPEGEAFLPGLKVRIVQPNIPQLERWKPDNQRTIFARLLQLTENGTDGTDVSGFTHVIWPESSVPFLLAFNGEILSGDIKAFFAKLPAETSLMIGAERAEGTRDGSRLTIHKVFNSLFLLKNGGKALQIYDKVHLVPFGEYMPLGETLSYFGIGAMSHQAGGFEAGTAPQTIMKATLGPAFQPMICYEAIFSGAVAQGANRPGLLVNITNDAWFGDSTGPYQHLHLTRIRAVEEGLPLLRAANTGVSAVIDPYGRILSKLSLGATGVVDSAIPVALQSTIYSKLRNSLIVLLFVFPLAIYLAMVQAEA